MTNRYGTEQRQVAASLLKQVLEGKIPASEALRQWPIAPDDELIEQTRCLLYHYRDDEDIRAGDEKYAKWQYTEFHTLMTELNGES